MAAEGTGMKTFYIVIGVVAVLGAAGLWWMTKRPTSVAIPIDVVIQTSDTAGFSGYYIGSEDALIEVSEYGDYECPFCQSFAVVQFPTIKSRLVDAGLVRWRFRDFPLDQSHPHARMAAHAAACADDQGRYWEAHEAIYNGQPVWSRERNAARTFRGYMEPLGLDMAEYDDCMGDTRHAGRIEASRQEGIRFGVNSTPSFVMDGRRYDGRAMNYDYLKALTDSLQQAAAGE
jgi:protein-disulfide isomerase